MKKKTSKSRIFVYGVIGVIVLAAVITGAVYLSDFMQRVHGA